MAPLPSAGVVEGGGRRLHHTLGDDDLLHPVRQPVVAGRQMGRRARVSATTPTVWESRGLLSPKQRAMATLLLSESLLLRAVFSLLKMLLNLDSLHSAGSNQNGSLWSGLGNHEGSDDGN